MTTDQNAGGRASRWSAMLDRLAVAGRLEVTEAAQMLEVSEATVRRDFAELASRQLASRTHGGIVATSVAYELPYRYRSGRSDDDMARIAERTASLLKPGDVIGLNGGTTTTATARALCSREDLADAGSTVVTNAVNIASEVVLRPQVRCICLGGVARPESYELTGPLATASLAQLWLDVAVIGVNGISAREGATCRLEDEAAIIGAMIERSQRVIVVAAGEKIGRRTLAAICPASRVDTLVTTADADPEAAEALREAGVEVILA
ncbi:DeoR/GlpR family DNA-binding transcription regulator [Dermacoccaceae bacterium W4C1]